VIRVLNKKLNLVGQLKGQQIPLCFVVWLNNQLKWFILNNYKSNKIRL